MQINRHNFLTTAIASGAAAGSPLAARGSVARTQEALRERYVRLDASLKQPVLRLERWNGPNAVLDRVCNAVLCE